MEEEKEITRQCGVWSWGWNPHGQLGRVEKKSQSRPTDIPHLIGSLQFMSVQLIACSHHYSALVSSNGDLFTWGDGGFGKLGHGDALDQPLPKKVSSISGVTAVSCGTAHTMCIAKGEVYTWGSGFFGALGHAAASPCLHPTRVGGEFKVLQNNKIEVVKIAASGNHSAAVMSNGALYTWGMNKYGQCGNFPDPQLNQPKAVAKLDLVEQVCLGEKHTVVLTRKGEIYSWGSNEFGQLGATTQAENQKEPIKVKLSHSDKAKKIICGSDFTVAVTGDNKVFTWGCADNAKLGHTQTSYTATEKFYAVDTRNKYAPKLLEAEYKTDTTDNLNSKKSVKFGELKLNTVSCGNSHSAGIGEDGKLWTWGWDKHGELGMRTDNLGPQVVENFRHADIIECGGYHTLVVVRGKYVPLQLACDNNVEDLQDLLTKSPKLISVIDSENGYNLMHWSAQLGYNEMIKMLIRRSKGLDLLSMKDNEGRTPLHIASMLGHEECVATITNNIPYEIINILDNHVNTAFHYAVKNGFKKIAHNLIERGAEASILDQNGKSAIFYCEHLEDAYELKVAANVHDVTVISQSDSYDFARKLSKEIDVLFVRCFLPVQGQNYTNKITEGKCVLFIVSDESVKSNECLESLNAAKKANKPIFSVWYHKPKLDSTLESLIFRRQLVDFTDDTKFFDSVSGLVSGLKKIVALGEVEEEEEEVTSDSTLELIDSADIGAHSYLFLVYDSADKEEATQVEQALTDHDLKVKRATDSLQQTSKHILHCSACVIIMSQESMQSKKVHDQIALAENHKKLLFPVFLEDLDLDAATQYTLAEAPKFLNTPTCLAQLASALHISIKIMSHRSSLALHAQQVAEKKEKQNETNTDGTKKEEAKKDTYWTF